MIKNNMGNVPERLWNSAVSDNPHIAHPETWYFKSLVLHLDHGAAGWSGRRTR